MTRDVRILGADGEPVRSGIVSRARDLVCNDCWASGAVTRILDNVIRSGQLGIERPSAHKDIRKA